MLSGGQVLVEKVKMDFPLVTLPTLRFSNLLARQLEKKFGKIKILTPTSLLIK